VLHQPKRCHQNLQNYSIIASIVGAAVSTLSSEALEFAGVTSRPLTLADNAASYGVESGTISAIVSANRQWWHSIGQGKTIRKSLSNSASAGLSGFGSGFAAGIVVGAPLQMLKTSGESVGVEATLTNPSSLEVARVLQGRPP